ncbi:MAG: TonB-dependent receptor [Muribaculaceae bacterium]|nr:TonB-dependent receptor [Muribaculaceae bacterium]
MRKAFLLAMTLSCGIPVCGTFTAMASPEPLAAGQAVETITGTVLDEAGEPLIGATVAQKSNPANGTSTDIDGRFSIRVARGTALVISYIGYRTVEVPAAEGMQVTLQSNDALLDEVVVVGYGSQRRVNLTGAVATVDVAKAMESRPVMDAAKALQGAVPGLTITTANGDIESAPTIKIRGVGTLSNNAVSNPLIIVDGVPVDDLSFVNPDDIKDISVLKDAASSAVYGTRAAFGVILVTTKSSGTQDRVKLKYSNNFSFSGATVLPKFANTVTNLETALQGATRDGTGAGAEIFGWEYVQLLPYAKKWQEQHGGKAYTDRVELKPYVDDNNVGDYIVYKNSAGKDLWLMYGDWDVAETLLQSAAPGQKHNVSIEGASGKTNYRLAFSYDSKEGLMKYNPDKIRRYNATASIDTEIFSWLKAGARVTFSDREYTGPNLNRNPYQFIWRWPGFFSAYGYTIDENGDERDFRNDIGIRLNSPTDRTITTNTRLQGWMQATIAQDLTLYGDFTYTLRNQNSDATQVPYTLWSTWTTSPFTTWTPYTQATSSAAQSNYRDNMWMFNIYATYAKTFKESHNFKLMVGATAEQEVYKYFYAKRTGLVDYNLPNINLTNGTNYTTSGSNTHRATAGFFGRVNYDYKGIYLLEVNGRYDGSSRFPESGQWAFFPSVSGGYRFSEEAYFDKLKHIVNNGKVRFSYGQIGNEAVGSNRFLSTVSAVTAANTHWLTGNQKISEYGMPTLVSSTLSWERIETTDIGLDLGFLDSRFTFGFDWYQRNTKDMLGPSAPLPGVLGVSAPYGNNGSLRTRGWELSLGWNQQVGDVNLYANFNLSDSRTKITKWNRDENGVPAELIYTYAPGNGTYTEGTYFGDIWGFETDRYFEESDFNGKKADGSWIYKDGVADQTGLQTGSFVYGPGDVKYKDLNGDGVINIGDPDMVDADGKKIATGTLRNHGDMKVIGNALPRYEYSFRIGANWRGFDADIFLQGVGKRSMWATGSFTVPMAQSNLGTFEHQQSYNRYIVSNDYSEIIGYEVNQNNEYPAPYPGMGMTNGVYSARMGRGAGSFYPQSRYLMDLSYLRVKNITLGYTLPSAITKKAFISKARVYVSGDNLFFLHNGLGKYKIDPELTRSEANAEGVNDGVGAFGRTIPQMRTYSFGLQVTF